jgi:hypothetical protein
VREAGEDGSEREIIGKAAAVIRPHVLAGSAGLGPSNARLASLALSGRWGGCLDRPPSGTVASDSEIRRTTSFIWTPVSCSLALRSSGVMIQQRVPSAHAQPGSPQYRPGRPVSTNAAKRGAESFAARCRAGGSHTPKSPSACPVGRSARRVLVSMRQALRAG